MKTRWWLFALLIFFLLGWLSGRRPWVADTQTPTIGKTVSSPTSARSARESSRKQWAERLRDRDLQEIPDLIPTIPGKDLGPSIEAWLDSFGIGGLDSEAVAKLWKILDVWVAEDADAAWNWAVGIQDPASREFVMKGIAGSLAETDPHRAFECLIANGEFRSAIFDPRLMELMGKLSGEALEKNPEELIRLWAKLPKAGESVNSFAGIPLQLGPETDFRALLQGMRDELGKPDDRPIYPSGVMAAWTRNDPEEAERYLVERIVAKEDFSDEWREMIAEKTKAGGSTAATQWTVDLLQELSPEERGSLVVGSGLLNSPQRIFDLIQEGASASLIRETLQAAVDSGKGWAVRSILTELPIEQRIGHVRGLRGPAALEALKQAGQDWDLTPAQMEEMERAIGGP